MPGAGSNRINEFGFYTNYYTLPKLDQEPQILQRNWSCEEI